MVEVQLVCQLILRYFFIHWLRNYSFKNIFKPQHSTCPYPEDKLARYLLLHALTIL